MSSSLCCCIKQPPCCCFGAISIDVPAPTSTSLSISRNLDKCSLFASHSRLTLTRLPVDSLLHGHGRLPTEGQLSHSSNMSSMSTPPPCTLVNEPFPSVPTQSLHVLLRFQPILAIESFRMRHRSRGDDSKSHCQSKGPRMSLPRPSINTLASKMCMQPVQALKATAESALLSMLPLNPSLINTTLSPLA